MMIDPVVLNAQSASSLIPGSKTHTGALELSKQFDQFLKGAITDLNQQQHQVDQLNEQFIVGEMNDVHRLMIASAKAELGLQLVVQVRNKVVEAYQDVMRMQL
ncbi:flagellar hook-basal body complex protein FliE [Paenibacillus sp. SAFN-117]